MRRTGDIFLNAKVTYVSFSFVLNIEDLNVLLLKLMFITTEPAGGRKNLVKFSKTPVLSLLKHLVLVSVEQAFTHLKAVGNT